jgi:hypothetical protein
MLCNPCTSTHLLPKWIRQKLPKNSSSIREAIACRVEIMLKTAEIGLRKGDLDLRRDVVARHHIISS